MSQELPADLVVEVSNREACPVVVLRMHETLTAADSPDGSTVELHEVHLIGLALLHGRVLGTRCAVGYLPGPDGGMRAHHSGDPLPDVLQRRVVGLDRLRDVLQQVAASQATFGGGS